MFHVVFHETLEGLIGPVRILEVLQGKGVVLLVELRLDPSHAQVLVHDCLGIDVLVIFLKDDVNG